MLSDLDIRRAANIYIKQLGANASAVAGRGADIFPTFMY